jgi:TRAP-type uncharacterized transport system substrate-binding protein
MVDLAVVRGDVGDLWAQAVAIVVHTVVLLVAPPGSGISDMAGLKRAAIGVVGADANKRLTKLLSDEYDFARSGVTLKNLALPDVRRALETKDVRAVLIVMPLAERYLTLLRGLFPEGAKSGPVLIPIESAGAIAEKDKAYESFDVPKGTLRGSPANPSDDVTTLRTSFYLVAQKTLDSDVVTDLTQSLMNARRDLLAEYPLLGQITTPDTDASAYIPLHLARCLLQRHAGKFSRQMGNIIFLAPMIAGALASVLAAAWNSCVPASR